MNVERYIASGKLEAYILGELNAADEQEVLRAASEYPEIREELDVLERTQEQLAFESAVAPPEGVRAALFAQIESAETSREETVPHITAEETEKPVVPATKPLQTGRRLPRWVPVGMAASIVWIVLSTGAALYFWQQWQQTEEDLQLASAQNLEVAQQYQRAQENREGLEQQISVLSDPNVQRIALQGLDISPDARAVVFWNANASQVYLNPSGLPALSANQQYQLWAIVDGAPVSAGVVPLESENDLFQMEQIANASAFAITLEPLGGSESPTMEAMYVMGEV
ncbi:MAG: anti-sigma factor [Cyclobacteriaceae bacterium]